ncbi:MAG: ABC transporter permease subunit [Spirochaetaceae bacterium]|nr:ABC transporter permease subunit [Spirochaetaceae bacterium]MDE0219772.1 ABC transporter permease subunit [Spirochaetaceae bacterium]
MTRLVAARPAGRLAERLFGGFFAEVSRNRYLFLLLLPAIVYFVTFHYLPMIGVVIAFQKYRVSLGFFRSPWVGLEQFRQFWSSIYSFPIIRNTFLLSFYSLLFGFPIPIIFAIALNEVRSKLHKRSIQTVSYLPFFISNVIAIGIVNMLVNPQTGVINLVLEEVFGLPKIFFLVEPEYFRGIYVTTVIWKSFGFTAVIYLAAIAGISQELFEAATVDGASKLQRIRNVTIPGIKNTMVVLLLIEIGNMMNVGFELVYLLYNPLTYETADVIATYVYRKGIAASVGLPNLSFAAAVGLFNSVVNTTLLLSANAIARRWLGYSLF